MDINFSNAEMESFLTKRGFKVVDFTYTVVGQRYTADFTATKKIAVAGDKKMPENGREHCERSPHWEMELDRVFQTTFNNELKKVLMGILDS